MKRLCKGLVAACAFAALVGQAVAQEAYSSSAVGVIKKTLPAGKRVLMSVPLDQESDTGQGFPFSSVPAISNLPNGTVAYFWDESTQEWVLQTKLSKGGWGEQKNRLIAPGEPFFLKNAQGSDIELVLSGEVPPDDQISRGLAATPARTLVANPYPVATVFTNFAFASTLPNGSVAYFWDIPTQSWIMQTKLSKGGWGEQKNRVVNPGEGLFIKAGSASTWTEVRPYTWPN